MIVTMAVASLFIGGLFCLAALNLATCLGGEIRPIDGLSHITWERPGHLTLGVILSLSAAAPHGNCGPRLRRPSALNRLESIVFAVDDVNSRSDLLPNVTLGFVIMDDCSQETVALLRALHFVQRPPPPGGDTDDDTNSSSSPHAFRSYPVVGVIGSELSACSMQMASLLSPFHIPQLSYASSSPLLSNKQKYKFFSRLVPSDRQQALFIADILEAFNWSYVWVLYSYSMYGQSGFKYLQSALSEKDYCIVDSIMIESNFNDRDFDRVIESLLSNRRARVVVVFALEGLSLLRAAQRKGVGGQFTWITSDAVLPNVQDFKGFEEASLGILLVGFTSSPVRRFEDALENYTLNTRKENPWFPLFYQKMFNCSTEHGLPQPPCNPDLQISKSPEYSPNTTVSRSIDAVYAFARALHVLTKDCRHAPHNASLCFKPEKLLETLRSNESAFIGESNTNVSFDLWGDAPPVYHLKNLRVDNGVYSFSTVGEWDGKFRYFNKHDIMWHPGLLLSGGDHPKSFCSEVCKPGEQAIRGWPKCCWSCEPCRENERTVLRGELPVCQPCPASPDTDIFTWPDEVTRTRCEVIPPTFSSFRNASGLIILALDLLVLALTLTSAALYVRKRDTRLIKASSRELSGLMLVGHVAACLLLPVFLLEPSPASCLVSHTGFHLCLTLVYAPLLVKTNRIYRIFLLGRRTKKKPRFVGCMAQIVASVTIVMMHLVLIAVWVSSAPPAGRTRMPNATRKYVERVCEVSERGFILSTVFNLVLMAACAVHSFFTRHLPANFNEAKFIAFCVYTIVVLWLSFLPTYFVVETSVVRTLCLTLALLVNVISCQCFLFLTKLYAVYKLPVSEQHLQQGSSESDRRSVVM